MTSNRRLSNPWYVPLHRDETEVKYFIKRRWSVHACLLFGLDEDQLENVELSVISLRIRTWHECGNWYWGRAIPFLGIFVSNFRHCVFAVYPMIWTQARGLISKVETIISVIFSERPRLMSGPRGPRVHSHACVRSGPTAFWGPVCLGGPVPPTAHPSPALTWRASPYAWWLRSSSPSVYSNVPLPMTSLSNVYNLHPLLPRFCMDSLIIFSEPEFLNF